jgi:hypothetical protein
MAPAATGNNSEPDSLFGTMYGVYVVAQLKDNSRFFTIAWSEHILFQSPDTPPLACNLSASCSEDHVLPSRLGECYREATVYT